MAKEIELRFLVDKTYIPATEPIGLLMQGYLHVDHSQQIRVRLIGTDKALICIKHMIGNGVERDEFEYEIPYTDGIKLYNKCKHTLHKIRYWDSTSEGYHVDIDWYPHIDLIVAEVELPAIDTKFTKPWYFGEEITGRHEYTNYHIAGIKENEYQ